MSLKEELLVGSFAAVLLFSASARATTLDLRVIENEKSHYVPGDIVVVQAEARFDKSNCDDPWRKIRFLSEGMKVVSATKWNTEDKRTWRRCIRLEFIESRSSRHSFTAVHMSAAEDLSRQLWFQEE